MSNFLKKIRPGGLPLLVVLLIALGWGGVQAYEGYQAMQGEKQRLHQELIGKTEQFESLSKVVGKLGVKYVEQSELRKEVSKQFTNTNTALLGRIKVLSKATWRIKSNARTMDSPDVVFLDGKYPYIMVEVRLESGLPLGYVIIYDSGKVVSLAYDYELNARTAVSRDESSGKYTLITKLDHTLKSPTLKVGEELAWLDRPFELPISGGEAIIDPTELNPMRSRFHWGTLRANLSVSIGAEGETNPGLGISFLGYGPSTRDLDFKFLGIGASITQQDKIVLSITPVYWRPFRKYLPNTYLGIGIEQNEKKLGAQFSLSLNF